MWWCRASRKSEKQNSAEKEVSGASREVKDSERPAPVGREESEAALDSLAAVLRTLGRYAFDIEDAEASTITQTLEGWARHVLVRSPPPGQEGAEDARVVRRDWAGLRAWINNHRKAEAGYVQRSLADLRQVIWVFVRSLTQAISEDGEADGRVQQQLNHLKTVATSNSTEDLKREALVVAATIGEVLEERKQRQRTQVAHLGERLRSLGNQLEEAKREGATDPLTRLFNRKAFDEYLTRAADMTWLFDQRACLLLIDVDHFKDINDTYGHPCGDVVLRQLADCIARNFLRRSDFVARYGGEEFGIVLSDTALRDAVSLAERLRGSLARLVVDYQGKQLRVTASIGVAEVQQGETANAWLERTDKALYAAKAAGRDRVVSDPEIPQGSPTFLDRAAKNSAAPRRDRVRSINPVGG